MKLLSYFSILTVVMLSSFTLTNHAPKVKDYFTVPGPISYNKAAYNLSWSAHPSGTYYKQEYLPANEKSDTYKSMVMIEAVTGAATAESAVKAKVEELEQRKKSDPLANYELIKNPATGEYLLDFIVSQSTGNTTAIVEWNAYRYASLTTQAGIEGIYLFGYSKRGYGAGTTAFLKQLKAGRKASIATFAAYKIPSIKLKP